MGHSNLAKRPLRLAFIGCGRITAVHSVTLALGLRTAVRRWYASRDPAKARAVNHRFRGAGWYHSYEAAFDDETIDAVLIATPPSTHLSLTLRALAAGKHVIVEKPAFTTCADAGRVAAEAQARGRRVLVAENYFYKPLARSLRRILASGEIGDARIISVNALKRQQTGGWRDDPEMAGGGALFEGGIHWVHLMANLGLPVEAVHGFRPGADHGTPERTMVAVFRYQQGAIGTLYHSWEIGSPLKGLRLSAIYGSGGTATFESNGLFVVVRGRRRRVCVPQLTDLFGYRAMFRDFLRAIHTDSEPCYTLGMAQRDLALVAEIYRSAGTSAPAQPPQP